MLKISEHTANCNPLPGARLAYKHESAKNSDLPRLVNGSGKLVAVGAKLYAVLETIGGGSAVISVTSATEWRYRRETAKPRLNGHGNGHDDEALAPASPAARLKKAADEMLAALIDVERLARAAGPESPNTAIAAE